MNLKDQFLRFWRSENEKIAILRDVLVALLAVFIVLLILWAYTGQWFAAPMVAIESGSMEHPNAPYGRLGTIDAGDMVLVVKVNTRDDVITHGGDFGGAKALNDPQYKFYENWGDVIIYKPEGRDDLDQIIHRAMCWVEVHTDGGETTYTIEEFGIYNQKQFGPIPELGLNEADYAPDWPHSGYLTKGDNNDRFDQYNNAITPVPVKLSWITGKARSEIPWIGTINLFFEDLLNPGKSTLHNVHTDSFVCLGVLIATLISIPIILDLYDYFKHKKEEQP